MPEASVALSSIDRPAGEEYHLAVTYTYLAQIMEARSGQKKYHEKSAASPFRAIRDAYRATKGFAKDPLTETVEFLGRNPRVEEAVHKVTNYRLMDPANKWRNVRGGAYLTSPIGALTGTMTGDTKEEKLRNALVGVAAGAGAGAAAGRYLPRVAQRTLGRVLTNVVDPHIYSDSLHLGDFKGQLKTHGVKGILRAIAKDQPIQEIAPARHALFRDFFRLKRFEGTENVFHQLGMTESGGEAAQAQHAGPRSSRRPA